MTAVIRAFRRLWPSLLLGAILAALLGNCILGPQGPLDLLTLTRRRGELAAKNADLVAQNAELQEEIAKLQSDPVFIKKMIRKELGYSQSNEFIYRFRSPESSR